MNLTAENVHDIFKKCLSNDSVDIKIVDGVLTKASFCIKKLEENKSNISDMLNDLPDSFKKGTGDGWSFLNMCEDNKGSQWTDFHVTVDELVCLGIAVDKMSYLMPREMWNVLPGGMPYLVIN